MRVLHVAPRVDERRDEQQQDERREAGADAVGGERDPEREAARPRPPAAEPVRDEPVAGACDDDGREHERQAGRDECAGVGDPVREPASGQREHGRREQRDRSRKR